MTDVAGFFDRESAAYHEKDAGFRAFHRQTARRLESRLCGRVLCVGGLWAQAEVEQSAADLIVTDISVEMLRHWRQRGLRTVRCDARDLPFATGSVDHLVLPLVLHHINDGTARGARRSVHAVLAEARRVLRPRGGLWISEFSLPSAIYAAELALVPVTRLLLSLARIPLVVMHSARYYRKVVAEAGFECTIHRIEAGDSRRLDLMTPVIGLPWLRVPRVAYPLEPILIEAVAP